MTYLLPAFTGAPAVNKVYHCDALTLLRALPTGSVDCVVTSPPYNLRNSTGNGLKAQNNKNFWNSQPMRHGYDTFADDLPHDVYVAQQREVLNECMRIIKSTGAIFYNHKWRVQAGLLQDRADIVSGLPVRQIIIWDRNGGFNFNEQYFLPTYEVIYLIAKPDFKLAKGANAYGDIWHVRPEDNGQHPNSFPLEIPRRCIEASSAKLVVDPFGGRGTTAKAAQMLGCQWITCDISANYCTMSREWLAMPYTPQMSLQEQTA